MIRIVHAIRLNVNSNVIIFEYLDLFSFLEQGKSMIIYIFHDITLFLNKSMTSLKLNFE